jgi:hypothetical protein
MSVCHSGMRVCIHVYVCVCVCTNTGCECVFTCMFVCVCVYQYGMRVCKQSNEDQPPRVMPQFLAVLFLCECLSQRVSHINPRGPCQHAGSTSSGQIGGLEYPYTLVPATALIHSYSYTQLGVLYCTAVCVSRQIGGWSSYHQQLH